MNTFFKTNRIWVKVVSLIVVSAFILNQVAFAFEDEHLQDNNRNLAPASRFKPLFKAVEQDGKLVIIEDEDEIRKLRRPGGPGTFPQDVAFLYVCQLIPVIMNTYGSDVSADVVQKIVKAHLPDDSAYRAFMVYRENNTICLPYERMDGQGTLIFRFFDPEEVPPFLSYQYATPTYIGNIHMVVDSREAIADSDRLMSFIKRLANGNEISGIMNHPEEHADTFFLPLFDLLFQRLNQDFIHTENAIKVCREIIHSEGAVGLRRAFYERDNRLQEAFAEIRVGTNTRNVWLGFYGVLFFFLGSTPEYYDVLARTEQRLYDRVREAGYIPEAEQTVSAELPVQGQEYFVAEQRRFTFADLERWNVPSEMIGAFHDERAAVRENVAWPIRCLYGEFMKTRPVEDLSLARKGISYHIRGHSIVHMYPKKLIFEGENAVFMDSIMKRYNESEPARGTDSPNGAKILRALEMWKQYAPGHEDARQRFMNSASVVELRMDTALLFCDPSMAVVRPLQIGRSRHVFYLSAEYLDNLNIHNESHMRELAFMLKLGQSFLDKHDAMAGAGMDHSEVQEVLSDFNLHFLEMGDNSSLVSLGSIRHRLYWLMGEDFIVQYTNVMEEVLKDEEEAARISARLSAGIEDFSKARAAISELRRLYYSLLSRYSSMGMEQMAEATYRKLRDAVKQLQKYDPAGILPYQHQVGLVFTAIKFGQWDDYLEELEALLTGRNLPEEILDGEKDLMRDLTSPDAQGEHDFENDIRNALYAQMGVMEPSDFKRVASRTEELLADFRKRVNRKRGAGSSASKDEFDILTEESRVLDLQGPLSRDDVFERISEVGEEMTGLGADDLRKKFIERENQGSTVMSPGMAIPHIAIDDSQRYRMVLVRCKEGIVFPEQEQPVTMMFALMGPRGTPEQSAYHMKTISNIAQVASSGGFMDRWMSAGDEEDMKNVILMSPRQREKTQKKQSRRRKNKERIVPESFPDLRCRQDTIDGDPAGATQILRYIAPDGREIAHIKFSVRNRSINVYYIHTVPDFRERDIMTSLFRELVRRFRHSAEYVEFRLPVSEEEQVAGQAFLQKVALLPEPPVEPDPVFVDHPSPRFRIIKNVDLATLPWSFTAGRYLYNDLGGLGLGDTRLMDLTALSVAPVLEEAVKVGLPFIVASLIHGIGLSLTAVLAGFAITHLAAGVYFTVMHITGDRAPPGGLPKLAYLLSSPRGLFRELAAPIAVTLAGWIFAGIFFADPFRAVLASMLAHFVINLVVLRFRYAGLDVKYATTADLNGGKQRFLRERALDILDDIPVDAEVIYEETMMYAGEEGLTEQYLEGMDYLEDGEIGNIHLSLFSAVRDFVMSLPKDGSREVFLMTDAEMPYVANVMRDALEERPNDAQTEHIRTSDLSDGVIERIDKLTRLATDDEGNFNKQAFLTSFVRDQGLVMEARRIFAQYPGLRLVSKRKVRFIDTGEGSIPLFLMGAFYAVEGNRDTSIAMMSSKMVPQYAPRTKSNNRTFGSISGLELRLDMYKTGRGSPLFNVNAYFAHLAIARMMADAVTAGRMEEQSVFESEESREECMRRFMEFVEAYADIRRISTEDAIGDVMGTGYMTNCSPRDVLRIIEEAGISHGEKVLDLGSGRGVFATGAAYIAHAQVTGVEKDETEFRRAESLRTYMDDRLPGLEARTELRNEDFLNSDIRIEDHDVVFMFPGELTEEETVLITQKMIEAWEEGGRFRFVLYGFTPRTKMISRALSAYADVTENLTGTIRVFRPKPGMVGAGSSAAKLYSHIWPVAALTFFGGVFSVAMGTILVISGILLGSAAARDIKNTDEIARSIPSDWGLELAPHKTMGRKTVKTGRTGDWTITVNVMSRDGSKVPLKDNVFISKDKKKIVVYVEEGADTDKHVKHAVKSHLERRRRKAMITIGVSIALGGIGIVMAMAGSVPLFATAVPTVSVASMMLFTVPGKIAENTSRAGSSGGPVGISIWLWQKVLPVISYLRQRGWVDTSIAGVLGAVEEVLLGLLTAGMAYMLLNTTGMGLLASLILPSSAVIIIFPLMHLRNRQYIGESLALRTVRDRIDKVSGVMGRLGIRKLLSDVTRSVDFVTDTFVPAPEDSKVRDMVALSILAVVARTVNLLPVLLVPLTGVGAGFVLIGIPMAAMVHFVYNRFVAARLRLAVGMSILGLWDSRNNPELQAFKKEHNIPDLNTVPNVRYFLRAFSPSRGEIYAADTKHGKMVLKSKLNPDTTLGTEVFWNTVGGMLDILQKRFMREIPNSEFDRARATIRMILKTDLEEKFKPDASGIVIRGKLYRRLKDLTADYPIFDAFYLGRFIEICERWLERDWGGRRLTENAKRTLENMNRSRFAIFMDRLKSILHRPKKKPVQKKDTDIPGLHGSGDKHFKALAIDPSLSAEAAAHYMPLEEFTAGEHEGLDVLTHECDTVREEGNNVVDPVYGFIVDDRTGDGQRISGLLREVIAKAGLSPLQISELKRGPPITVAVLDASPHLGENCRRDGKAGINALALSNDDLIGWILHHEIVLHEILGLDENMAEMNSYRYFRRIAPAARERVRENLMEISTGQAVVRMTTRAGDQVYLDRQDNSGMARRLLETGRIVVPASDGTEFEFRYEDESAQDISPEEGKFTLKVFVGGEYAGFIDVFGNNIENSFDSYEEGVPRAAIRVQPNFKNSYAGTGAALMTLAMAISRVRGNEEFLVINPTVTARGFFTDLGFVPAGDEVEPAKLAFDLALQELPLIRITVKGRQDAAVTPVSDVDLSWDSGAEEIMLRSALPLRRFMQNQVSLWATDRRSSEEEALRGLNIGGNIGRISNSIERRTRAEVVDVDMADLAPGMVRQGRFVKARAEELPFEEASQDFVMSSFLLNYTDKDRAISEMRRVLRPGGRAFLVLHRPDSFLMSSSANNEDIRPYKDQIKDLREAITWFRQLRTSLEAGTRGTLDEDRLEQILAYTGYREYMHPLAGSLYLRHWIRQTEQPRQTEHIRTQLKMDVKPVLVRLNSLLRMRMLWASRENMFANMDDAAEFFRRAGFEVRNTRELSDTRGRPYAYGLVVEKPENTVEALVPVEEEEPILDEGLPESPEGVNIKRLPTSAMLAEREQDSGIRDKLLSLNAKTKSLVDGLREAPTAGYVHVMLRAYQAGILSILASAPEDRPELFFRALEGDMASLNRVLLPQGYHVAINREIVDGYMLMAYEVERSAIVETPQGEVEVLVLKRHKQFPDGRPREPAGWASHTTEYVCVSADHNEYTVNFYTDGFLEKLDRTLADEDRPVFTKLWASCFRKGLTGLTRREISEMHESIVIHHEVDHEMRRRMLRMDDDFEETPEQAEMNEILADLHGLLTADEAWYAFAVALAHPTGQDLLKRLADTHDRETAERWARNIIDGDDTQTLYAAARNAYERIKYQWRRSHSDRLLVPLPEAPSREYPAGSIPRVFEYLVDNASGSAANALDIDQIAAGIAGEDGLESLSTQTIKDDLRALLLHLGLIRSTTSRTGKGAKFYVPGWITGKKERVLNVLSRFKGPDLRPTVRDLQHIYLQAIRPLLGVDLEPLPKQTRARQVLTDVYYTSPEGRRLGRVVKRPVRVTGFTEEENRSLGIAQEHGAGLFARSYILEDVDMVVEGEAVTEKEVLVQDRLYPLLDVISGRFSVITSLVQVTQNVNGRERALLEESKTLIKEFIDRYIAFQQEMWRRGLFDYDIAMYDVGVNADGQIVGWDTNTVRLLPLTEEELRTAGSGYATLDDYYERKMREALEVRRLADQMFFECRLCDNITEEGNGILQELSGYFRERMEQELTVERLRGIMPASPAERARRAKPMDITDEEKEEFRKVLSPYLDDTDTRTEYTPQDLIDEGYLVVESREMDRDLNALRVTVKIYADNGTSDMGSLISFLVIEETRTIIIENFYPDFPVEKKGRGRALLRLILSDPHYAGYEIIGNASGPFQRSLLQMQDFEPIADIGSTLSVADRIGRERLAELEREEWMARFTDRPALYEELKDHWGVTTIHCTVPEAMGGLTIGDLNAHAYIPPRPGESLEKVIAVADFWSEDNASLLLDEVQEFIFSLRGKKVSRDDRIRLEDVLIELGSNMMEHARGGRIRIYMEAGAAGMPVNVRIIATDNGPGLPDPNMLLRHTLSREPGSYRGAGSHHIFLGPDNVVIERNGKKWTRVSDDPGSGEWFEEEGVSGVIYGTKYTLDLHLAGDVRRARHVRFTGDTLASRGETRPEAVSKRYVLYPVLPGGVEDAGLYDPSVTYSMMPEEMEFLRDETDEGFIEQLCAEAEHAGISERQDLQGKCDVIHSAYTRVVRSGQYDNDEGFCLEASLAASRLLDGDRYTVVVKHIDTETFFSHFYAEIVDNTTGEVWRFDPAVAQFIGNASEKIAEAAASAIDRTNIFWSEQESETEEYAGNVGVWHENRVDRALDAEAVKKGLVGIRGTLVYINWHLEREQQMDEDQFSEQVIEQYRDAVEEFNKVVLNGPMDPERLEEEYKRFHAYLGREGLISTPGSYDEGSSLLFAGKEHQVRRIFRNMFSEEFNRRVQEDAVAAAAEIFTALVNLQPFHDGNKRAASFIMNYILMKNGYTPFILTEDNAVEYIRLVYPLDDIEIDGNDFSDFLHNEVKKSVKSGTAGAITRQRVPLPAEDARKAAGAASDMVNTMIEKIEDRVKRAGQEGNTIIIGIDTSWIPDDPRQQAAIQGLLNRLSHLSRKKGFTGNIIVRRRKDAKALVKVLEDERTATGTALSNMIVLGSYGNITGEVFNTLKGDAEDAGAFFAGVDLPADFPPNAFINIVEMLTVALNLAFGTQVSPSDYPYLTFSEGDNDRMYRFIPAVRPYDYEALNELYRLQRDEINIRA